jgi:hypothetical protein
VLPSDRGWTGLFALAVDIPTYDDSGLASTDVESHLIDLGRNATGQPTRCTDESPRRASFREGDQRPECVPLLSSRCAQGVARSLIRHVATL